MDLLRIESLYKSYQQKNVLNGINLKVSSGDRVALLGSNGAGKSTLINICSGLVGFHQGKVSVLNQRPGAKSVKHKFALLPQVLDFPKNLKVKEVIAATAQNSLNTRNTDLIKQFNLERILERYCYQLSGGEKRRVALYITFQRSPTLAFLDEPTANIDIQNRDLFYNFISDYYQDPSRALIITSHLFDEIERIANRIVLIHSGKIVLDGSVKEVVSSFNTKKISYITQGVEKEFYTDDPDNFIRKICKENIDFHNLNIQKTSLEDIVFMHWSNKNV